MFNGSRNGVQSREWVTSKRVWFDGAFTYYYPTGDSLLDVGKRADFLLNQLVGQRIDADVLWNLQPWSWLADWYVNIGTNIANASALTEDGLVMRYGYLMTETISDHVITINGPRTKSGYAGPFKTIYRTVVKERVKASPYGFALNPSGFTARQWAILAALGFTKAPGALH